MNLSTLLYTNYVRTDEDWIVEVSFEDFAGKHQMRAIAVSRDCLTEELAVQHALNSLRKSSRKEGWVLPPQIFSSTPRRRIDWHGKYPKERVAGSNVQNSINRN
jgi:hypothetical protein